MRQGGVVGNNPIIDMIPDSTGTYQPQTNKQTESLAEAGVTNDLTKVTGCLLYTSPSPRDNGRSRMPSSA